MVDQSNQLTKTSDSGERPLIDAAWAQFESLAARHKSSATDARRSVVIPGYRVLREIHRGGQGVVYQAMQESTRRKVAIKVLKEGSFADPTELSRFDREVDVLSRLNHPHIVAIHDRGLTAEHAYYVMDYIPGRPLDAYVAGADLSTREILILCRKVCEAVNIAHLRGVIHRDLKPSNIRIDENGDPRVLDFGLAKLSRDMSTSVEAMTMTGQFVGSLPWASPEQAEGRSELLDIRTDVYSLGVILYQLLTGSFPYPVSGRMSEVVRNILQTSPARPSTLAGDLDRDVEVIVLKCLAKDPERRYQSAGELARDIQRFLSGEPIEARPATSIYQLRQFARRNKALVVSVSAIMMVLTVATAVSVAFALREAAARAQTRAVADFQAQMLADIDPQTMGARLRTDLLAKSRTAAERLGRTPAEIDARGKELEDAIAGIDLTGLALTSLDENVFQRALAAIEKQFADQPLLKAQLLQTVASTERRLGLLDAATRPQELALAIRRNGLGVDHRDTFTSTNEMGVLLEAQGKLFEAQPYFAEALERRRRVLGSDHPDTLNSLHGMGRLLQKQNKLTEAEPYHREALEKYRRVLGDEHAETLMVINNVGFLLQAQGHLGEAERHYREALEARRRILGDEHPQTLTSINSMGFVLHARDSLAEAEPYYREALETRRRVLGEGHPDTLTSINNMGGLLRDQGKLSEAERFYREALEKRRRVLGEEHPETIDSINNMGWLFDAQGKLPEAELFYREAMEKRRRVLGDGHPDTLQAIGNMSHVLYAQGRATEAAALLASAEPTARRVFAGGNAVRLGRFLTLLGRERVAAREFEAAEANLTEARAILSEAQGTTEQHRVDALDALAKLYEAWHSAAPNEGYDAKAAEWRAKLVEWQTSSQPPQP